MDEEMLRPFFCTQSLGPFLHLGAKLKGGCETKGGCIAATKPTLCTPMFTYLSLSMYVIIRVKYYCIQKCNFTLAFGLSFVDDFVYISALR